MRLGMVGLLPADFRRIRATELEAIQRLGLTGACFHRSGDLLASVDVADCQRVRALYRDVGMELVQFGIGYKECLFSPDQAERAQVLQTIERGIEVAEQLGAEHCLIRTGSLSSRGSYSPTRENHTDAARERLLATLRQVAAKAESHGQTMVIETHVLTIMNSPEYNASVVDEIGSERIRIVMDYVNHFQTLAQVYNSKARIQQIFELMGDICPVGHCKDIRVNDGFVVHFSEELPGAGELDLAAVLHCWEQYSPRGYMLLEHLSAPEPLDDLQGIDAQMSHDLGWSPQQVATYNLYAQAARNVHSIAAEAGVPIV